MRASQLQHGGVSVCTTTERQSHSLEQPSARLPLLSLMCPAPSAPFSSLFPLAGPFLHQLCVPFSVHRCIAASRRRRDVLMCVRASTPRPIAEVEGSSETFALPCTRESGKGWLCCGQRRGVGALEEATGGRRHGLL